MSDEVTLVLKHAFVGSVVASAVSFGVQEIASAVTSHVTSSMKSSPTTNAVVGGMIAGSVAAVGFLAGEKIITSVMSNDDPLFRLFYYQVAFHGTAASWGFARVFRLVLSDVTKTRKPPVAPMVAETKREDKPCCGGTM